MDDDKHIYKVPRPVRSQSFTCPTPPLPIQQHRISQTTLYTQNQLYSVIPSSAPPVLPQSREASPTRDYDPTQFPLPPPPLPPAFKPRSSSSPDTATGFSSSKRRWKNSIPTFGSFRDKSKKDGIPQQVRQQQSSDYVPSPPNAVPVGGQPVPGDTLTLGRLAQHNPHSFPLQVKMLQSFSFQTSQLAITNSDLYQLLLVKQQQFVSMQDRLGMTYSIPLNSAVQFGYVNSCDRKSSPHTLAYKSYTKVGDILALGESEIPKIMCAQHSYKGTHEKYSVAENEVLLVLQAKKSKLSGRKYLKVYSFSTRSRKTLYPDCVGHFTTNPAHLRLWLTDMINVPATLFPCQAIIYLEKRFTSALKSFPSTLLQADSYVTLSELSIQTSIVARIASPPDTTLNALLDMPIAGLLANLQVQVQVPDNVEALQSSARMAYDGLDMSSLLSLDDSISERAHSTKCLFYTILRRGNELVGVHLLPPLSAMRDNQSVMTTDGERKTSTDSDSDSDPEHYEKINDWFSSHDTSATSTPLTPAESSNTPTFSQPYELLASSSYSSGYHSVESPKRYPLHSQPSGISSPLPEGRCSADEDYEMMESPTSHDHPYLPLRHSTGSSFVDVTELKSAVRLLEERVVPLERKIVEHHQLQSLVRSLSLRITKMERQLLPQPQPSTISPSHMIMSSNRAGNIAFLCTLNSPQVLVLLDSLNLSHYKPTFQYMGITGERLSRYTDQQLEKGLGVIPPKDRERLLQVINGSLPTHELLSDNASIGEV